MSVSQTEMTLLCNFAWKKIGLKRESHPLTTGKKYVAVYCDHRQAKKEVVLGSLSGQWAGGETEPGGSSRMWSRRVAVVSSVLLCEALAGVHVEGTPRLLCSLAAVCGVCLYPQITDAPKAPLRYIAQAPEHSFIRV